LALLLFFSAFSFRDARFQPILGALYRPYPATGPPKSRALQESVTAQILSLEAIEQAYHEAVHGVSV